MASYIFCESYTYLAASCFTVVGDGALDVPEKWYFIEVIFALWQVIFSAKVIFVLW